MTAQDAAVWCVVGSNMMLALALVWVALRIPSLSMKRETVDPDCAMVRDLADTLNPQPTATWETPFAVAAAPTEPVPEPAPEPKPRAMDFDAIMASRKA